jgi:hypothetical protein
VFVVGSLAEAEIVTMPPVTGPALVVPFESVLPPPEPLSPHAPERSVMKVIRHALRFISW